MPLKELAKQLLPEVAVSYLRRSKKNRARERITRLPGLTESGLTKIVIEDLWLNPGDTVFIHSSLDRLNLDFPFYRIIKLLRDVVGPRGTLLFPTNPNHGISSFDYLLGNPTFNVRKTPSYIGLLTEFARRQPGAKRSLHPTKPVCAIGPLAHELTHEHQNSPYPFDTCSPYYKLTEHAGKVIGLGVWTFNLSFGYVVEDFLKDEFPVPTYHERLFEVPCINYQGVTQMVRTYGHNMKVMETHDGPLFMRSHIAPDICRDLEINGMKFFRADAPRLFEEMLRLARLGVTAYPRSVYRAEFRKAKINDH